MALYICVNMYAVSRRMTTYACLLYMLGLKALKLHAALIEVLSELLQIVCN